MKLNKILMFAAMTCVPLQHAFSAPVTSVDVQVIDVNAGTSPILLEKMSASMQVVATQLFVDKDTTTITAAKDDYIRLLTEIGDRVFTGYELTAVDMNVGGNLSIALYARPWSSVITEPKIDLEFSGVEPQTASLLQKRIPQLKEKLRQTISGASVDASDWAGGVLRKMVREEIERQLPEFKAAVDVLQENNQTVVQIVIYPVGQLVRNIDYELRSEAVPNILLMNMKYKYAGECDKLRGLPLAYIKRQKQELEQILTEKLLNEPEVKNFNLQPVVTLTPEADLGVNIMITSDEYKIWFEGYGDIGRDRNNLSGKAHIGKFVSKNGELFGEAEVLLDDVEWRFAPSYAHYWGKSTFSYMRRIPLADNVYKLEYNLSPKWRLRAEHFSGDDRNEFAVRYRIHEFLSAEYVYGGDELYLQIIGNL